jgi:hypothetical protein
MRDKNRRSFPKAGVAATGAAVAGGTAREQTAAANQVHDKERNLRALRRFRGAVSYGNLLFAPGKGAPFEGDIIPRRTAGAKPPAQPRAAFRGNSLMEIDGIACI